MSEVVNELGVRLDEVVEWIAYAETSNKPKPIISKGSEVLLRMLVEDFFEKNLMILVFEGAVHNMYRESMLRCAYLDKLFEQKGGYIYSMVNDIVNQHYEGCWSNPLLSITNAESIIMFPQHIETAYSQECITRKPEGLFRKAVSSLEYRVWLNKYYHDNRTTLTQQTLIDLIDCNIINDTILSSELKSEVIRYICQHIREDLYSKYEKHFMYVNFGLLFPKLNS